MAVSAYLADSGSAAVSGDLWLALLLLSALSAGFTVAGLVVAWLWRSASMARVAGVGALATLAGVVGSFDYAPAWVSRVPGSLGVSVEVIVVVLACTAACGVVFADHALRGPDRGV